MNVYDTVNQNTIMCQTNIVKHDVPETNNWTKNFSISGQPLNLKFEFASLSSDIEATRYICIY